MGYDNRQALPDGFELSISDAHTGGQYSVTIQGEIGRGGNCIVYSGLCRGWIGEEQIEKNVVIKEFYPISLSDGIKRDPDMQFTVDTSIKDRFDSRLSNFICPPSFVVCRL